MISTTSSAAATGTWLRFFTRSTYSAPPQGQAYGARRGTVLPCPGGAHLAPYATSRPAPAEDTPVVVLAVTAAREDLDGLGS
ncbi:hypothetical protein [Streptomyces monashensis]|uniref:hypothetical protein n=1 Tax=Streptomyces monashensis TaxID=1678012 RepID=UPI0015A50FFB|nr:hypothetical protein [Streptomyces monashensis]